MLKPWSGGPPAGLVVAVHRGHLVEIQSAMVPENSVHFRYSARQTWAILHNPRVPPRRVETMQNERVDVLWRFVEDWPGRTFNLRVQSSSLTADHSQPSEAGFLRSFRPPPQPPGPAGPSGRPRAVFIKPFQNQGVGGSGVAGRSGPSAGLRHSS